MKRVLFIVLFLPTALFSQSHVDAGKSDAEKFSERDGSIIRKTFIEIGAFKKCDVKVVKYTDVINNDSISELRFSMDVTGTYTSDTKIASLDVDEVDALLKALRYIKDDGRKTEPKSYTEIEYTTRSGFTAGCYYSRGDWKFFIKLERYDSKSYQWFNYLDLEKLINLIEQGAKQL